MLEEDKVAIYGVDFCCGIGGVSKGLLDAGIHVVKGIDIDESCRATYERNCKPAKFVRRDIQRLSPKEVMAGLVLRPRDRLLFSLCAPCQPFSRQHRRIRFARRSRLMFALLKFVVRLRPDYVMVENVPEFALAQDGKILRRMTNIFQKLGYRFVFRVVDCRTYGLPQSRHRFFLLAALEGKVDFPEATHGLGKTPFSTVRDAISRFPRLDRGESDSEIPNHRAARLSSKNLLRIRSTPKDGGSRSKWASKLRLKCHRNPNVVRPDVYGRMSWDSPAPTLTTRCISLSNGRYGHPDQDRAISLREAAAIQGFSDDFVFQEHFTRAAAHVGNAVPPIVVQAVARGFLSSGASSQ